MNVGLSKGLFLVGAYRRFGFNAEVLLRNTMRNPADPLATEKGKGVNFGVEIFDYEGSCLYSEPSYGKIEFNSYVSLKVSDLLSGDNKEKVELLVVIPEISTGENIWFEQEHEIIYSSQKTKSLPSVIYDQLPLRVIDEYAPIILLNHKIYISKELNSVIALANYRGKENIPPRLQTMELNFFDEKGKLILRKKTSLPYNSCSYIDVKMEIGHKLNLTDSPILITMTARGGNSLFAIETMTLNEKIGTAALEHSLAPTYFVSQNMREVREKALLY
ncbi:hypothetical protein EHO60_11380 [Leptospira fletcheri]|uniref:Uncharacterized protein n=1 Tax=Leptospira fletcheri TaxID=2484981 RepID=A0A4R9GDQ0_9LEPT|nr:hypothetical protein [Leptospira fletcheri]TGK09954.1 hypothetical protein EHO60_11380 [Leptospira fletcheri]